MELGMKDFSAYDLSSWQEHGLMVRSKTQVVASRTASQKRKQNGVSKLLILSFLAVGMTYLEPKVVPAQVSLLWDGSKAAGPSQRATGVSRAEYLPPGYLASLINRMKEWPTVSDKPIPDFDSLAG